MTDRKEAAKVNLDQQREIVDKQNKAVGLLLSSISAIRERETWTSVSLIVLTEKASELASIKRKAKRALDILDFEGDEDQLPEDLRRETEFTAQAQEATAMLHDMESLKRSVMLTQCLEKDISHLEDLKAANSDEDHSACFKPVNRVMEQIQQLLFNSTLDSDHEAYQQFRLQKKRLLTLRARTRIYDKPTTVFISDQDRSVVKQNMMPPRFRSPRFLQLPKLPRRRSHSRR